MACTHPRVYPLTFLILIEILSNLETNIAYFEREQRSDDGTIWADWSPASRKLESDFMKPTKIWSDGDSISVPQRLVVYPDQIPQAAGISNAVSLTLLSLVLQASLVLTTRPQQYDSAPNPGEYYGYMFRRNFTFGLASPSGANDGAAWAASGAPPTSWQFYDPKHAGTGTNPGEMTDVACAINTFDQTDVYRYDYNGLCWNGGTRDGTGWGAQRSYSGCIIDFAGPGAGSKKRAIGKFNGWNVYSEWFTPYNQWSRGEGF